MTGCVAYGELTNPTSHKDNTGNATNDRAGVYETVN